MKFAAAIKIMEKCVEYYVRNRLAFRAHIYELGIDKGSSFENAYNEREKIEEAIKIIKGEKK